MGPGLMNARAMEPTPRGWAGDAGQRVGKLRLANGLGPSGQSYLTGSSVEEPKAGAMLAALRAAPRSPDPSGVHCYAYLGLRAELLQALWEPLNFGLAS